MQDIPWYGWFNLIGLLVLWFFYGFSHVMEKSGKLTRYFHHLVIFSAAAFVSGWYQLLPSPNMNWLTISLGSFLLAATAWEILGGTYMVFANPPGKQTPPTHQTESRPSSIATAPPSPVATVESDGGIDLDAGTCHSAENRQKVSNAIERVFDAKSSGSDRLKSAGTLLGLDQENEPESPAQTIMFNLLSIGIVAIVLVPPGVIAWRVIKSLV